MAKIWKVTYEYVRAGQQCALGLHYQWNGVTASPELTADQVAISVDGTLRTAMRLTLGASDILERMKVVEEVDPSNPALVPEVSALAINQAGTGIDAAGTQAAEIVPLFHRKSGAAVRGGQSWCFGPSPQGGAPIVAKHWDTGSLVYGWWAAFVAKLDDVNHFAGGVGVPEGDLNPVVYARTRRKRGLSPYTFQVTSTSVEARPRWLRSRGD